MHRDIIMQTHVFSGYESLFVRPGHILVKQIVVVQPAALGVQMYTLAKSCKSNYILLALWMHWAHRVVFRTGQSQTSVPLCLSAKSLVMIYNYLRHCSLDDNTAIADSTMRSLKINLSITMTYCWVCISKLQRIFLYYKILNKLDLLSSPKLCLNEVFPL